MIHVYRIWSAILFLVIGSGVWYFAVRDRTVLAQSELTTDVSGQISQNETWTREKSPYVLTDDVIVAPGATLTIEPGVEVRGKAETELTIRGTLQAIGTTTLPITFTSDTNTAPEQWSGVVFDGGSGRVVSATLRYAGHATSLSYDGIPVYSNIAIRNSSGVQIEYCTIRQVYARGLVGSDVADYGIFIQDSTVEIHDTLFTENGNSLEDFPIIIAGELSYPRLYANTFTGNQNNQIRIDTVSLGGSPLVFQPQTGLDYYRVTEPLTVTQDSLWTIEPGTDIRSQQAIKVLGHLDALGTETQPITLTSVDQLWPGMMFDGSLGKGTGHLRYVTVSLGGSGQGEPKKYANLIAVNVQNGSLLIEHSQVRDSRSQSGLGGKLSDKGLLVDTSIVRIRGSSFVNNGMRSGQSAVHVLGDDSRVTIEKSSFLNSHSIPGESGPNGLVVEGGQVNVMCSTFTIEAGNGIWSLGGGISVTQSSLVNNWRAVRNQVATNVEARYNWWGATTGPVQDDGSGGTNSIVGNVLFEPWLQYVPDCQIRVYLPIIQRAE